MISRRAGRVIVRDDAGAVLLCHARVDDEGFWFTPGGGTGPGETAREAAVRELHEETGIAVELRGPAVLHRRAEFTFLGRWTEQVESFWLAGVDGRPALVAHHLEDYEHDSLDDWAWWPPDELAGLAAGEDVYPACLVDLLDHLDGPGDADLPWLEEHVGSGSASVLTGHEPGRPLPDWALVR